MDGELVGASLDDNNGTNAGCAFAFFGEVLNQSPMTDDGIDQTVVQQGPAASNVVLDGFESTSPDGHLLTFT